MKSIYLCIFQIPLTFQATVPVHVPVEAVVVGDELVLPLVVELTLEVEMLQPGQVGLVAWRDRDKKEYRQIQEYVDR